MLAKWVLVILISSGGALEIDMRDEAQCKQSAGIVMGALRRQNRGEVDNIYWACIPAAETDNE